MKGSAFTKKSRIRQSVSSVFGWHEKPGAILRLSPPWDPIQLAGQSNGIQPGSIVNLKITPLGPLRISWTARHAEYEKNRLFQDVLEKGPFSRWVHTHRFTPDGDNACFMEDRIEYALPFHAATAPVFSRVVQSRLERIFTYRHHTVSADLADHHKYGLKPMNIMVSGSHGIIASTLIPFLTTGGHRVFRLVRKPPEPFSDDVYFNPAHGIIDMHRMENMDIVIHLAGENIGSGPWIRNKKNRILESRTKSTALLAKALSNLKNPPKLFACASAIGYYGNCGEETLAESGKPGCDFISDVCEQWEASAAPAKTAGIRTVFLRIGVVLTPAGGALKKMLPVFNAGLGGPIGTGRQYMSWIGIDDVAGAILHIAANQSIRGPINIVSPEPVQNRDFAEILGRVLSRPALLTVPETVIKMLFGQMGEETVLASTRVLPEKLTKTGYRFRHPDLTSALSHVLGKTR